MARPPRIHKPVSPLKAGIHKRGLLFMAASEVMDSCFRGNDEDRRGQFRIAPEGLPVPGRIDHDCALPINGGGWVQDMRNFLAVAPLILLAACVAPERAPAPVAPAPPAPLTPAPAPIATDWRDTPLTPGGWAYRIDSTGSSAMFGRAGEEADLILRCDFATRRIILSWPGALAPAGNQASITTSEGTASYTASAAIGVPGRIGLILSARDPFLDRLAFSRGRFLLGWQGRQLVIPAWPEPARAIEDCRK